ncbi:MAG: hypothetical protein RL341_895 [Pseudomonadota bacterium]|jgi:hypothetical protein
MIVSIPRLIARAAAVAALLLAATAAHAQAWQWKDEQGRMQFSDQPPPASIKPENIIKTPSGAPARPTGKSKITYDDPTAAKKADEKAAAVATTAPASAAAAAAKPAAAKDDKPMTTAEREADFQKRKKAEAEAADKAAKEAAVAKEKQQACTSNRNNLAALESGQRIARPNAKGEREFLDDSGRAAEIARAKESIAKACS